MKYIAKRNLILLGIAALFMSSVVVTIIVDVSVQDVQASSDTSKHRKTVDKKAVAFKMGEMTEAEADKEYGTHRNNKYGNMLWSQKIGKQTMVRKQTDIGSVDVHIISKGFALDKVLYRSIDDNTVHGTPHSMAVNTGNLSDEELEEEATRIADENQWHANDEFGEGFRNKKYDVQWNIQIGDKKMIRVDSIGGRYGEWYTQIYSVHNFTDKLNDKNCIVDQKTRS